MPCDCDFPEITHEEKERISVMECIVYLAKALGSRLPMWVRANDNYGNSYLRARDFEHQLYKLCDSFTPEEKAQYIYDGCNPKARKLADWWDEKQAETARRKKDQKALNDKIVIQNKALSKLTDEEKEALNIRQEELK